MATLAERFEALVDRSGHHHLWRGATDHNGVPQIRVDGRLTTARRVAWELQRGPLPDGARVRRCTADSRCVRVEHLAVVQTRPSAPRPARVRRPRGEGSMREIRPGVWKLTVTTRSQDRVSRTIEGDCQRAEVEIARLAAQHGHPPITLDGLVHLYLTHLVDAGRSTTTVRRYAQLWRTWLAPALGTTPPADLRTCDIETALASMARSGQSRRSIHQATVVLNSAYAWAREHRLATSNPLAGCELPDGTILTGSRRR